MSLTRGRPAPALRSAGALILLLTLGAAGFGAACGGEAGGSGAPSAQPQEGAPQPAAGGQATRTVRITIGGVQVTAEIADNEELRGRGLMYRDSLPENHGMLFVYGTTAVRSFWMRNTRIPLDIAFIDGNGVIINIEQMEPQSDRNYFSQGPMMYALEMSQGWFEAHGVEPGDRLDF